MKIKHTLLLLFAVFFLGSAYPSGKLGTINSIPPILFGSLRMGILFICLIPFCKLKIPEKKYIFPLIGFCSSFGVFVNMFLYLSIDSTSILAPITIGAQLSIPIGIILSSFFLKEKIHKKKYFLILAAITGVVVLAFDPKVTEEYLASIFICAMAFFYAASQVFSRYLKNLDIKFTNALMSLVGFIILFSISFTFEGNSFDHLSLIKWNGWIMIIYSGAVISIFGHMVMFYLYKFYPVDKILPFYSLFPIFSVLLSFIIFGEIPTLLMIIGGIIVITSVFFLNKMR